MSASSRFSAVEQDTNHFLLNRSLCVLCVSVLRILVLDLPGSLSYPE